MESALYFPPLAAAGLSAVLWGTAMIADTLMIRDCYAARPAQPLIISSIFGAILGLFFSFFHALYIAPYTLPTFVGAIAAFIAGLLMVVATYFLFVALNSEAKDSAEVAAYGATAPVAVLAITGVLYAWGIELSDGLLTSQQWAGIAIATGGLALLAAARGAFTSIAWRYRGILFLMLLFVALYYVIMDFALGREVLAQGSPIDPSASTGLSAIFSVLPFYWLGLAGGGVALVHRGERNSLVQNARRILVYLPWIVLLELLAMLSFAAEIYGLGGAHPALVGVVAEMHVLVIFFAGYALRRLNLATEDHFPPAPHPVINVAALVLVMLGITLALTSSASAAM